MTKKIKWRLGTLPSPEEVADLFKQSLLTKEEAREILFSEVDEKERDVKSLESEIKFLRELVERLSKDRTKVIETIRTVQLPYYTQYWFQPYQQWCGVSTGNSIVTSYAGAVGGIQAGATNAVYTATSGLAAQGSGGGGGSSSGFNTIKTF